MSRVDDFKADVAAMRVKDPALRRDRALLVTGAVALVAGVLVAIYAYALSHSTSDQRQQFDAVTIGLVGVTISVLGAALFVRYSFAQFMRFWMARSVYEQQAQTDRVVDALTRERSQGS